MAWSLRRSALVRSAARRRHAHTYLPDWTPLGITSPAAPSDAARVLLATLDGGNLQAAGVERVLASALTLRGHHVDTVLCDRALPACIECSHVVMTPQRMASHGPRGTACRSCTAVGERAQRGTGSTVHHLSAWITEDDRREATDLAANRTAADLATLELDGVHVGEHAVAGALRFLAVGTLPDDPTTTTIVKRYLAAAVLTARAAQRLLAELRPTVVVLQHGIYVPQGPVVEVARAQGVRIVTWSTGSPAQSFLFSHDDTYHRTMLAESPSAWADAPWSPELAEDTREYLESRRTGSRDWVSFGAPPSHVGDDTVEALARDGRPVLLLLTNVIWDAQVHFEERAFPSQAAWLEATVDWARERSDVQVVIRAHPAEKTGYLPARERVADVVRACDPPANVVLVDADSPTSTYDLVDAANAVAVYGTKVAVEAAGRGTPVIVAGEAWIRGKGLSIDVDSPEQYRRVLDSLPLPAGLDEQAREDALRYARHLFLRRMVPVRAFQRLPQGGALGRPIFAPRVEDARELAPGADPGLDVICAGIVDGTPFALDRAASHA